MGKDDYLRARADSDLVKRVDSIASRYEMDHSKLVRILVRSGLDKVEADGLDAVIRDDQQDADPAN